MDDIFAPSESLDSQMKRIQQIRGVDENKFRSMYLLGEDMLDCAKNGRFNKFQRLTYSSEKKDILLYFVVKMLQESLIAGHLMITGFIIDHGFPIGKHNSGLPSSFHEAIKVVSDDRACSIIEFLVSKNVDINLQEHGTFETVLHIAIRRRLYGACRLLMDLNADVNAVAKNDVMPLNLAMASLEEDEELRAGLINSLQAKGARNTWRKQQPQVSVSAAKPGYCSMSGSASLFSTGGSVLSADQFATQNIRSYSSTSFGASPADAINSRLIETNHGAQDGSDRTTNTFSS